MNPPAATAAEYRIFSYGTLQQPEVQRAIFGHELVGQEDILPGYRIGTVPISNAEVVRLSGTAQHPGLIHTDDSNDRVPGVALAVTSGELTAADAYEAADYVRVAVTLASGTAAFVYVARSGT